VSISSDPGRFICNYTAFRSYRRARESGRKRLSLFCHVPSDETFPLDRRLNLAMDILAGLCDQALHPDDITATVSTTTTAGATTPSASSSAAAEAAEETVEDRLSWDKASEADRASAAGLAEMVGDFVSK
jgi:hypothetical protein